jgi:hypothetical protein
MKRSTLILGMLILTASTLAGAAIQGRLSRRWGGAMDLTKLAKRLQELPADVGPWHMRESKPLEPAAKTVLECAGYVGRVYENRQTGEMVTMAVLLGPAGPISVHTPDVCYSSQEYSIHDDPERTTFTRKDAADDQLWKTTLRSTRLEGGYLRVYYGWNGGRTWSAPYDARFAFLGQPYLYKIQVAAPLSSLPDEKVADPGFRFITALLPVLRENHLIEPAKE